MKVVAFRHENPYIYIYMPLMNSVQSVLHFIPVFIALSKRLGVSFLSKCEKHFAIDYLLAHSRWAIN